MAQRRTSLYLQGLTFFGLGSDYKKALFKQIHEIVFHGQGGYDWHTVYNMPIWLRNFTFQKMNEHYEKEAEEMKKATKGKGVKSMPKGPAIRRPSYTSKAPK